MANKLEISCRYKKIPQMYSCFIVSDTIVSKWNTAMNRLRAVNAAIKSTKFCLWPWCSGWRWRFVHGMSCVQSPPSAESYFNIIWVSQLKYRVFRIAFWNVFGWSATLWLAKSWPDNAEKNCWKFSRVSHCNDKNIVSNLWKKLIIQKNAQHNNRFIYRAGRISITKVYKSY